MVSLPAWVKPEAIAHHKPSYTCFVIGHCQRERKSKRILLLDAPKGAKGAEYPLDECEPASPEHFKNVALLTVAGKAFSIVRQDNLLIVSGDGFRGGIRVAPQTWEEKQECFAAAESLAAAFEGVITHTEEVS